MKKTWKKRMLPILLIILLMTQNMASYVLAEGRSEVSDPANISEYLADDPGGEQGEEETSPEGAVDSRGEVVFSLDASLNGEGQAIRQTAHLYRDSTQGEENAFCYVDIPTSFTGIKGETLTIPAEDWSFTPAPERRDGRRAVFDGETASVKASYTGGEKFAYTTVELYYSDGGAAAPTSHAQIYRVGESLSLPSLSVDHYLQHAFTGWADNAGNRYQNGAMVEVGSAMRRIEAVYAGAVSVTFAYYAGDREEVITVSETAVGGKVTPPALSEDHRPGHLFTGWSEPVNEDGTISVSGPGMVITAQYEEAMMMMAAAAAARCEIFFMKGPNSSDYYGVITVYVGSDATERAEYTAYTNQARGNTPANHTFVGWSESLTSVPGDIYPYPIYRPDTVDVTFKNPNTGVTYGTIPVSPGGSISPSDERLATFTQLAQADTPAGHTFMGWNLSLNNIQQTTSVTPVYKVKEYTVVFVDRNYLLLEIQTVRHGESATVPANFNPNAYEGLEFSGWDRSFDNITADMVIMATYVSIVKHKVTFKNKDQYIYDIQMVRHGEDAVVPAEPMREGYTFEGWVNEQDLPADTQNIQADRTFYAAFKSDDLTVIFLDHEGRELGRRTAKYNEAPDMTGIDPERPNYVFLGWSEDISHVTRDMTVRAQYKLFEITVEFKVPYTNQSGQSEYKSLGIKTATLDESRGLFTVPLVPGYTWELNGLPFSGDIPANQAEDKLKLIVYDPVGYFAVDIVDEVSGSRQALLLKQGMRYPLIAEQHDGYTFTGWESDPAVSIEGGYLVVEAPCVVTARYEQNSSNIHWISYYDRTAGDPNARVIYRQSVADGGTVTAWPPGYVNPSMDSLAFLRWDATLPIENITGNISVYPIFESMPKVVFYNWDNAVTPLYETYVEIGKLAEYKGPAPTRVGYEFVGWSPDLAQTPIEGDTEFHALFRSTTAKLYQVMVYYQFTDGEEAQKPFIGTYAYGETYDAPSPTTIVGYEPNIPRVRGTIGPNTPTRITEYVTYLPSTGTPYKVNHYQQKLGVPLPPGDDQDTSRYNLVLTDTHYAMTGATITLEPKTFVGFSLLPDQTMVNRVAANGETVLNIFYTRDSSAIFFNAKGGNYVEPIVDEYGATITEAVKESKKPTRKGYTFMGWDSPIPNTMPATPLVLEAQWQPDSSGSYTVVNWIETVENEDKYHFHSTSEGFGPVESEIVLNADALKSIRFFEYKKYDVGKTVAGDGSTIVNVYYARKTYTVTFKWADIPAGTVARTISAPNGTTVTYPTNFVLKAKYEEDISQKWPTTVGLTSNTYTFGGWRMNINGQDVMVKSKRSIMTSDYCVEGGKVGTTFWETIGITDHLHYMMECLDPNDPSGVLNGGIRYKENPYFTQTVYSAVNRQDWTLKTIEGFTARDEHGIAQYIRPNEYDIYLYYRRNSYDLVFHNFNRVAQTLSLLYETPLDQYSSYVPPRPSGIDQAWEFRGWYTSSEGVPGTEFVFAGTVMGYNNRTLYAKWGPPERTVRFYYTDKTGQHLHDTKTVLSGEFVDRPADPVYPGYVFQGWYLENSNVPFQFESQRIIYDTDLYAKWVERVDLIYTVNYWLVDQNWKPGDPATVPLTAISPNPKTVTHNRMGSTVFESARLVKGYTPDIVSKSLIIDAQDNEINFYYKAHPRITYTVYYQDDKGAQLLRPKTVTTEESVIVEFAPDIPGYSPLTVQRSLELSTQGSNTITFVYKQNERKKYTIEHYYMDQDTGRYPSTPDESEEKEDLVGLLVEAVPIPRDGYTLDRNNSTLRGYVAQDGSLVLSLYYSCFGSRWTINHLRYGTTIALAPAETGLASIGATKTATEIPIKGYEFFESVPASKQVVIRFDSALNVINLYYKPTGGLEVTKEANLGQALLGYEIEYLVSVKNTTVEDMTNVVAKDPFMEADWVIGTLKAGQELTQVYTYDVTLDDVMAGSVDNTITVTAKDLAGADLLETADEQVEILPNPGEGLLVTKSADKTSARMGETITYTVRLKNVSGMKLTNIEVQDSLGLGNLVLTSGNATKVGDKWVVSEMAAGAETSLVYTYVVKEADALRGSVKNTAVAKGTNESGGDEGGQGSLEIPVAGGLKVEKSADKTSAKVGDTITYTVTVTNLSGANETNVEVRDSLGLSNLTLTSNNAMRDGDKWVIPSIAAGAQVALIYTYVVKEADAAAGHVTNAAATRDDEEEIVIPVSSLLVTKRADKTTARFGETITYTVTLRNQGSKDISDMTVEDSLGLSNLTLIGGGAVELGGKWFIQSLPAKTSMELKYTYVVTESDALKGYVENTVVATGITEDGAQEGEDGVVVPVNGGFTVEKRADKQRAKVGETITYTVRVTNLGAEDERYVEVTDTLGLNNLTLTSDNATRMGDVWVIARLNAKQSIELVYTYVVTEADGERGSVTNAAATMDDEEEIVIPVDALSVTKTADKTSAKLGDTITYTVMVRNYGSDPLSNVSVSDLLGLDNLTLTSNNATRVGDAWVIGALAAKASVELKYTYEVTEADALQGFVKNTAIGKGTDGNGEQEDRDEVIVPIEGGLRVLKSADKASARLGEIITYTVKIWNLSDSPLTNIAVKDSLGLNNLTLTSGNATRVGEEWIVGTLPANRSIELTYTYQVTESDVIAGSVKNAATVRGTNDDGEQQDQDEVEVPVNGGLTVTKSANKAKAKVGDTITYTVRVTNLSRYDEANAGVKDTLGLDNLRLTSGNATRVGDRWVIAKIKAGQYVDLVYTYVVTPADGERGQVTNAVATIDDEEELIVPVDSLMVEKRANKATAKMGDTIIYTVLVHNYGAQDLTNVTVEDSLGLDNLTLIYGAAIKQSGKWVLGTLPAKSSAELKYTYVVTEVDAARGSVTNTAIARGTDENGAQQDDDQVVVPVVDGLRVLKSADKSSARLGETITYTVKVWNFGASPLTNVAVEDTLGLDNLILTSGNASRVGEKWIIGALAAKTSVELTYTYVVTEADAAKGLVKNTAIVTGTGEDGEQNDQDGVEVPVTGGLMVNKRADKTSAKVGDTITYTVRVTNLGKQNELNVEVEDALGLDNLTLTSGNANRVGDKWIVALIEAGKYVDLTYTYVVTDADAEIGSVTNVAATKDDEEEIIIPVDSLKVIKSADKATARLGETITYTVTVYNYGIKDLTDVAVRDTLGLDNLILTSNNAQRVGDEWVVGALDAKTSIALTYTYVVTETDAQTGSVVNTAIATGTDEDGDQEDQDNVEVPVTGGLKVTKSADKTSAKVGETITYTVRVTNLGKQDETNVEVEDTLGLDNLTLTSGNANRVGDKWVIPEIKMGARVNLTYTYVVTAADAEVGAVTNAAAIKDDEEEIVIPVDSLKVVKGADVASAKFGDTITYTVTVYNYGTKDLTNVTVEDTLGLDSLTLTSNNAHRVGDAWLIGPLAAKSDIVLTYTYDVTAADPQRGYVKNVAIAKGTDENGEQEVRDEVDIPIEGALRILKSANKASARLGETITYTVKIWNMTDSDLVDATVEDTLGLDNLKLTSGNANRVGNVWSIGTLAPRASIELKYTYVVTENDVKAGSVLNAATVKGTNDDGPQEDQDGVEVPVTGGLAVKKSADRTSAKVGDRITYTVRVTNLGGSDETNVEVKDTLGLNNLVLTSGNATRVGDKWVLNAPIKAGEYTDLVYTYVVTAADGERGRVVNAAATKDDEKEIIVPVQALRVVKRADKPTAKFGDTITYTVTVYNYGTKDLTNVAVKDLLGLDNLTLTSDNATRVGDEWVIGTLAAKTNVALTYTYVVTDVDAEHGSVTNTAIARGTDDNGEQRDEDEVVTPVEDGLRVVKSADKTSARLGETITYTVKVWNFGPMLLTGVAVKDTLGLDNLTLTSGNAQRVGDEWVIGTLAAKASIELTYTYVATEADAAKGAVTNTAIATGTDEDGDKEDQDSVEIPVTGGLKVDKSADKTSAKVGETITYTVRVTNLGENDETNVEVEDTLGLDKLTLTSGNANQVGDQWIIALIEAEKYADLVYTYVVTEADAEVGSVTNAAATKDDEEEIVVPVDSLKVIKGADKTTARYGETITYTVTVYNYGTKDLTDVAVKDSLGLDNLTLTSNNATRVGDEWVIGTLAAKTDIALTYTYVVTEADAAKGAVTNTAIATGTDEDGDQEDQDNVEIPVTGGLKVDKSADKTSAKVGDTITYTVRVTNLGKQDETNVEVEDTLGLDNLTLTSGNANQVGDKWIVALIEAEKYVDLTYTYVVTDADAEIGFVTNAAATKDDEEEIVVPVDSLKVSKSADKTTARYGETITYTVTVYNYGTKDLTDVVVKDSLGLDNLTLTSNNAQRVGDEWVIGTLTAKTNIALTYTYVVTEVDAERGSVTNAVVAKGTDENGEQEDEDEIIIPVEDGLRVIKSADKTSARLGETITYTVKVWNFGAKPLTDVAVEDTLKLDNLILTSGNATRVGDEWIIGTLAAKSNIELTYTYVVTEADAQNGSVTNTAIVTGTGEDGDEENQDSVEVPVTGGLMVNKSADKTSAKVGETITYTVRVTNLGTNDETNVEVEDTLGLDKLTLTSGNANRVDEKWVVALIEAGKYVDLVYTYVVTDADAEIGFVTNAAATKDDEEEIVVPVDSLKVIKSADKTTARYGETIAYTVTVYNYGTKDLTDVAVKDSLGLDNLTLTSNNATRVGDEWVIGTLAAKTNIVLTYTYVVTETDAANGAVTNTAIATGTDEDGDQEDQDSVEVPVTGGLKVDKSADKTSAKVGETITYTVRVTNLGENDETNVEVEDTLGLDKLTLTSGNANQVGDQWIVAEIKAGAYVDLIYTYVVTEVDAEVGSVTNAAATKDDEEEIVVPVDSLKVIKSADRAIARLGDTVTYTVTVYNYGVSDLTDVTVKDTLGLDNLTLTSNNATRVGDEWIIGALAVKTNKILTYTYVVTEADAIKGSVKNTAIATETDEKGNQEDRDSVELPIEGGLRVIKSANKTSARMGEIITYSVKIWNLTGSDLTDVTIGDSLGLDKLTLTSNNAQRVGDKWVVPALGKNQSIELTYTYVVTEGDLAKGGVTNAVTVAGTDENGGEQTGEDELVIPVDGGLKVNKSADKAKAKVSEIITYTVRVTNLGGEDETNVEVEDTLGLANLTLTSGNATRAGDKWVVAEIKAGAYVDLVYTYVVTEKDAETGYVTNAAATKDDEEEIIIPVDSLKVVKRADKTSARLGETITYTVTVHNYGAKPLTDVAVQDTLGLDNLTLTSNNAQRVGEKWVIGIVPAKTNVALVYTYVVTEEDVVRELVTNTAIATGTDENGDQEDQDSVEIPVTGGLKVNKSADKASAKVGETITYTVRVTNLGKGDEKYVEVEDTLGLNNLTLTSGNATRMDDKWVIAEIKAGAHVDLTYTYVVTAADGQRGHVTNAAATKDDEEEIVVPVTSLVVTKRADKTTARYGDTITYTLTVYNHGAKDMTGVTINDTLGLDNLVLTSSNAQRVGDEWVIGSLAAKTNIVLTYTYIVTEADVERGLVKNTAIAKGIDEDGAKEHQDSVEIPVTGGLMVTKSADRTKAKVDDTITYTVRVTNLGKDDETNVEVEDTLGLNNLVLTSGNANRVGDKWVVPEIKAGAYVDLVYTYVVTEADAEVGSVTNAAATKDDEEEIIIPVDSLKVIKSADKTTARLGEVITYTVTVHNYGGKELRDVAVEDTLGLDNLVLTSDNAQRVGDEWVIGTLPVRSKIELTYTYVVTEADAQRGSVTNTAIATGTNEDGDQENEDGVEIPVTGGLAVTKRADKTSAKVGEIITYTVRVMNLSDADETNVEVEDTLGLDNLTLTSNNAQRVGEKWIVAEIKAGAHVDLTYTYVVTEADAEAGSVTNAAATKDDEEEIIVPVQSLKVEKSADKVTAQLGETITYTVAVHNYGPKNLTDVAVEDTLGLDNLVLTSDNATRVGDSWVIGSLAAKSTIELTYTYRVTEADAIKGFVKNTAIAKGTDEDGEQEDRDEENIPIEGGLRVIKRADKSSARLGETITYAVKIWNLTESDLTDVTVGDSLGLDNLILTSNNATRVGEKWVIGALAKDTSIELIYTYVVTESDLSEGAVTNAVTVTGTNEAGGEETGGDELVIPVKGGLRVDKSADKAKAKVGETITYTVRVTNLSDEDEANVEVEDTLGLDNLVLTSGNANRVGEKWVIPEIKGGESIDLVYTYVVTEADAEVGSVTNAAATKDDEEEIITPVDSLKVEKRADKVTARYGDTITYTVAIHNYGSKLLTNVTISDSLGLDNLNLTSGGAQRVGDEWLIGTLAAKSSIELVYTYEVTEDDVKRGSVTNAVLAKGTDENGGQEDGDEVVVPIEGGLKVNKSADKTTAKVGEVITYTVRVTNLGAQAETNVEVEDVLGLDNLVLTSGNAQRAGDKWVIAEVGAGQYVDLTYTYVVTEEDAERGQVTNAAATKDDEEEIVIPVESLKITKTADRASALFGDTITYTLVVSNFGTKELTNVTVEDLLGLGNINLVEGGFPEFDGKWVIGRLPAKTSVTLSYTYEVTEADAIKGFVQNTAIVRGTDDDGDQEDRDEVTVPIEGGLRVLKSADKQSARLSEVIRYSVKVWNLTGSDLRDVMVNDTLGLDNLNLTSGNAQRVGDAWLIGELKANTSIELTYTYVVTDADVTEGSVTNVATVKGTNEDDEEETGEGEVVIPIEGGLKVQKSADKTKAKIGEVITYTVRVTNLSEKDETNVEVEDTLGLDNLVLTSGNAEKVNGKWVIREIKAGAYADLVYTYVVTEEDAERGQVTNAAATKDDEEEIVIPVDSLKVTKSADKQSARLGETITYTVKVQNLGAKELTNVTVKDSLGLDNLTLTSDNATRAGDEWVIGTLAAKTSIELVYTYEVTEEDVKRGSVTNTALAKGTDDNGEQEDEDEIVTPIEGGLKVEKSADKTKAKIGETITYTVRVTNLGNENETDVEVEDTLGLDNLVLTSGNAEKVNGKWVIREIEAGAYADLVYTYVVTEADAEAGFVTNAAATKDDEEEIVIPVNALKVTKSADKQRARYGETITYTVKVRNLGEGNLANVTVEDSLGLSNLTLKSGNARELDGNWVIGTLEAATETELVYTYVVTEADELRGFVKNTATGRGTHKDGAQEDGDSVEIPIERRDLLTYNVHHIVVDSSGATTGKVLARFDGETAYDAGDMPTLTEAMLKKPARGYEGYTFATDDAGSLLANGKTYYARYRAIDYTVSYQVTNAPAGYQPPESRVYHVDDQVRIEATPAIAGTRFTGWQLNGKIVSGTFTMPAANVVLTGTFTEEDDVRIRYVANTGGEVDNEADVIPPLSGSPRGSTAIAGAGYRFTNWTDETGKVVGTSEYFRPEKTNGIYVAAIYTANFAENDRVTIRYQSASEVMGGVSIEREILAPATGIAQGSEALANPGYKFLHWTDDDGRIVSTIETFVPGKVNGVYTANTYTAHFTEDNAVIIRYVSSDERMGTVGPDYEALAPASGEAKGSTATVLRGYRFKNWTNRLGQVVSTEKHFIPEKVDGLNVADTYTANFEELPLVTIRYIARTGGKVSVTEEQVNPMIGVPAGSTATARSGYTFKNWTDAAGTIVGRSAALRPTKDANAQWNQGTTYYANFTKTGGGDGDKITIRGTKTWIGVPEGTAYPTVTIELYQNGRTEPYRTTTIENGGTNYVFADVPKYDGSGREYQYTVREVVPDDFTGSYGMANPYDITNTYAANITSVSYRKVWVNASEGQAMPNITVLLLQDGRLYRSGRIATHTLGGGNWSGRFENLPKTAPDGHTYVYTVMEAGVTGFTTSITGSMNEGFTITNTARTLNVFFIDWNGTVLKHEIVPYGGDATPPEDPFREGYTFMGWGGTYTNVIRDEFVYAIYQSDEPLDDTDDPIRAAAPSAFGSISNNGDCIE